MLNVFPIIGVNEWFLHQAAQILLFTDILFNAVLDNIVKVTHSLKCYTKRITITA